MTKNNDDVSFEAVFRLKPNRTEPDEIANCDIKFVGYISPTDKLGDEVIEIETTELEQKALGKNTHLLGKINGYDITVNVYRNNIVGNYLISNRNLPVCSLQFMYAKNIVVGYLFNIFIYFVLDPQKNVFLTSPKSYVGAKVYGKYVMILDSDKEISDNLNKLDNKIEEYATEDIALEIGNNNLTEEELINLINKNIEEKKEFYNMLIKGKEVNYKKNIKKFAEDNLIPIYKNKHITGLIKFALDMRAKKRIKEYGGFEGEYKIPDKVLNLNDIKKNPELIDKYLEDEE